MAVKRPRLLVISGGVSTATGAAERPAPGETAPASSPPGGALVRAAYTVGLAAALVAIAFVTGGGVEQNVATPGNTWTEIVLIALGALAVGAGLLRRAPGERRSGWIAAALMGLLFADTAASIAWSWAPDASWIGASQMLAYLAVFAGAIMLARPWARGWPIVLGAIALWAATLCAWSLLVKVFPSALAAGNQFGRLQAPFGYWNAIALCAGMGLPCCLWLGARRDGGRRVAALAAPAMTLLLSVLVLSYSRSADAAAAVAAGLWLVLVPLRLRAIAMLLIGAVGAAVISAWFLSHHGLAGNYVRMSLQDHAGHIFGIVLLLVLVLVSVVGVAVSEAMDRTTVQPETRRRIGSAIIALLITCVVLAIVALAFSSRGLTGEISYRWHELTNPAATVSAGSASRVFQFGSSRPLYWHEALFVGSLAHWKGVGELGFSVARLLDPVSAEPVFQAHSYVFQTYADLGAIGLTLSAALLLAWLLATGRSTGALSRWRGSEPTAGAERAALSTLAVLVVGFGVQSTLDWTWYFAGLSVPALIAAGWAAGRGQRLTSASSPRPLLDRPATLVACICLVAATIVAAWLVWRPLRSAQLLAGARSVNTAEAARAADPFSPLPYDLLSSFALDNHNLALAQAELVDAVKVQPHNPQVWEELAQFLVDHHRWGLAWLPLHEVQILDRAPDVLSGLNNHLIAIALPHFPSAAMIQRSARRLIGGRLP